MLAVGRVRGDDERVRTAASWLAGVLKTPSRRVKSFVFLQQALTVSKDVRGLQATL